ncbi:MAG: SUMF1/EgtB/PvdO family nonheme iron enzyme, partial [Anaerolineae bacterium]
ESVAPGQQARRILESRLSATGTDEAAGLRESPAPLGDADTNMVTMGQSGMRTWTPSEQELITASLTDRTRRLEEQRRIEQEREQARQRELEQAQKLAEKQSQSATRLRLLVVILALLALVGPVWLIRQEILKNQARTPLIKVPEIQISTEMAREPLSVPEFHIEQFEVANWQYRLCVEAGVCAIPVDPMKFNDPNLADHPVVYVTAYQADQYCRWLGRRLPAGSEWERAARGTGQGIWPWGDDPIDLSRVNMNSPDLTSLGTVPTDSYPDGRTPGGLFHMIGNVWEWATTVAKYDPDSVEAKRHAPLIETPEVELTMRGASYLEYPQDADWVVETVRMSLSRAEPYLGFRCVKD